MASLEPSSASPFELRIGTSGFDDFRVVRLRGLERISQPYSFDVTLVMEPHLADTTDVVAVIRGVIEAEQGAIDHYTNVIRACEGVDYVTADMVTKILADEEGHLREFEGFLKEYEKR